MSTTAFCTTVLTRARAATTRARHAAAAAAA
jgi:hypothetical protein